MVIGPAHPALGQELRRAVPGEVIPDLGMVNVFSEDSLLTRAGFCDICVGGEEGISLGLWTSLF